MTFANLPVDVVLTLVQKTRKNLGSIKVLNERRKHYFWRLGEIQAVIPDLDESVRGSLFEVVTEFASTLDLLFDGEKWYEKVNAFNQSRRLLPTLEEKDAIIGETIDKHLQNHRKVKRETAEDAEQRYKMDLEVDFKRTKEVVEKETFSDVLVREAKEALKRAKIVFKNTTPEEMDKAIKRSGVNDDVSNLMRDVLKLVQIDHPERENPAKQKKKPTLSGAISKMAQRVSGRFENHKAFVLEFTGRYNPTAEGGFYFSKNEKTGNSEFVECIVFIPGTSANGLVVHSVKKTSFAGQGRFSVTIDDREVWGGKHATFEGGKGEHCFELEGHKCKVGFRTREDKSQSWFTSISGKNTLSLPTITPQEWLDATKVGRLNNVLAVLEEIPDFD